MLYKFFNKKGNITVILIGVISVMLLMTAAVSRRMSGHTQLLTISDCTQISRYFLESYMGDVMQQLRAEVNKDSTLATFITSKKIEDIKDIDLCNKFYKKPTSSDFLEQMRKELKIVCKYEPEIKIVDSEESEDNEDENKMDYTGSGISFPEDGCNRDKDNKKEIGIEKKGLIKIVCKCEFNKREYTLEVKYRFSIVYRMTPILKDFMLFVDNMWAEQRAYPSGTTTNWAANDKLNILSFKDNKYIDNVKPEYLEKDNSGDFINDFRVRPMILSGPLSYSSQKDLSYNNTGMVYLGPTTKSNGSIDDVFDKSIFYNISGTTPKESNGFFSSIMDMFEVAYLNDTCLIPKREFSSKSVEDNYISEDDKVSFPIGYQGEPVQAYGLDVETSEHSCGSVLLGVFGFCDELSSLLGRNASYTLETFLGDKNKQEEDTYWKQIYDNYEDYLKYSSGIKLFGLSYCDKDMQKNIGIQRQVFGNVFERFVVLTFWNFEGGKELPYNPDVPIDEVKSPPTFDLRKSTNFKPNDFDESMSREEKIELHRKYMSKIVSGIKTKDNYKKDGFGKYQNLFIPLNTDYDTTGWPHDIIDEDKCKPNDGFSINRGWFDKFGKIWFGPSSSEHPNTIEQRIGRAYVDQEKFKMAVGYSDDKDKNKKFNINGVVYVGGNLELDDMVLENKDCSGGIVLVDGDITLNNIDRKNEKGEKTNVAKFEHPISRTSDSYAIDCFQNWNDDKKSSYIGADKIITFVCIGENRTITIKGNVLLGVQLINLTSRDPDKAEHQDQITWDIEKNSSEIVFYGSIICNRLNLLNRLIEFGKVKKRSDEKKLDAPFFLYPPVMATSDPPLAVQINENMKGYRLTCTGESN